MMKNTQFLILIALVVAAAFGAYKLREREEAVRKDRVELANRQLVSRFEMYGGGL